MNPNALNGTQRTILQTAILSAFTKPELDQLLSHGDKDGLDNLVAPGPFAQQVFDLIKLSQRGGWTDWLLSSVLRERPNNPKVSCLSEDLKLADKQAGTVIGSSRIRASVLSIALLLAIIVSAVVVWFAQTIYYKGPDYVGLRWITDWRAQRQLDTTFGPDDFCIREHQWTDLSGDGRYMDLLVDYAYASDDNEEMVYCKSDIHSRVAVFQQKDWTFTYLGGAAEEANGESHYVLGRFLLADIAAGGESFLNVKGIVDKDIRQLTSFNAHEAGYEITLSDENLLVALDQGLFRIRPGKVGSERVKASELARGDDLSVVVSLTRSQDTGLYALMIDDRDEPLVDQGGGRFLVSAYVKRGGRIYVDAYCKGYGYKRSEDFFGAWVADASEPEENPRLTCRISHGEHYEHTPLVEISLK